MSEKKPFSYDDLFPDRWLHAEDLQGREVTLRITAAYQEDLRLPGGSVDTCGVLSFAGTKREYVLNKTNAMVLAELWGKDSSAWIGHHITIAAVPDTSGKSASGLRILFVATPDIGKPVKVKQPQGSTRTIRVTKKAAAAEPQGSVDPVTGEVEEAASGAEDAADGAATGSETAEPDVPGMDAEAFKSEAGGLFDAGTPAKSRRNPHEWAGA